MLFWKKKSGVKYRAKTLLRMKRFSKFEQLGMFAKKGIKIEALYNPENDCLELFSLPEGHLILTLNRSGTWS